jgi:secondary thiamine-phosphate synthase enzyme
MFVQKVLELKIRTRGRGFYDISDDVRAALGESKIETGLATLHIQHTSASLVIQENADPEVRRDFERFFHRLVPDGDPILRHTSEGPDDMPAHIRTALTAVNLSIPIRASDLTLGAWQGI